MYVCLPTSAAEGRTDAPTPGCWSGWIFVATGLPSLSDPLSHQTHALTRTLFEENFGHAYQELVTLLNLLLLSRTHPEAASGP